MWLMKHFILLFLVLSGFSIEEAGIIKGGINNCSLELISMINQFIKSTEAQLFFKYSARTLNSLGNYDLCRNSINSRYIALVIKNLPIAISFGFCLPSVCTSQSLNPKKKTIAEGLTKALESIKPPDGSVDFTVKEENVIFMDQTEQYQNFNPFNKWFYISIFYFTFMIIMCILGTIFGAEKPITFHEKILKSFSLKYNFKEFFSSRIRTSEENIRCLDGIRVFSISWVVLGHTFINAKDTQSVNPGEITKILTDTTFAYIYNATYSVDVFFFLAAFLLGYFTIKLFESQKGKGKVFSIFMIYIHRVIRLYPSLISMFLFVTFILPTFGFGPVFTKCYWHSKECQSKWYHFLLFYNNFDKMSEVMCAAWAWYIAIDTQFFIISPFLLLILFNYFKAGITIIIGLMITSFGLQYFTLYHYNISAAIVNYNPAFADKYYQLPYLRISPWLFGLISGYFYFCYLRRASSLMKFLEAKARQYRLLTLLIELACLSGMIAIVFVMGYFNRKGLELNRFLDVSYLTFSRCLFCILLWLSLLPTVFGVSNFITRFLSLKVFDVLGKATYSIYQTHCIWQLFNIFDTKSAIRLDAGYLHIDFINYLLWAFIFSLHMNLFIEFPIFNLEKFFLTPVKQNRKEIQDLSISPPKGII